MTTGAGDRATPRLYVLAPSHFCERARWALDQAGVAYVEERWALGPHALHARRLTAPRTCLPILDIGTRVIQDSSAILDWCALPGCLPELERRFAERIGPLVRRYLYAALLNEPASNVLDILLDGVPAVEAGLARITWPVVRQAMIAGMGAQAEQRPGLAREIAGALAWFGNHVAGRPYIVGDEFGRADLTAASLLAPLARPKERPLYQMARLPEDAEAALAAWRETEALRWVLRVYADHRCC